MKLHRTPVHHQVMQTVRAGQMMWRDTEPGLKGVPALRRSAGFVHRGGLHLEPHVLVALWELKQAALIEVVGERVQLSSDGCARLAEWEATRAVNR